MDGREVVECAGQQREGHGQAVRRANQVQPPTDERLTFGGTVATILPPAHRPAAPPAPACRPGWACCQSRRRRWRPVRGRTDRRARRAAGSASRPARASGARSATARTRERAREIPRLVQQGERAGVLVPEEGGRHHRDGEHLRVGDRRKGMARMAQHTHRVVNHHVIPIMCSAVTVSLPSHWCLSQPQ